MKTLIINLIKIPPYNSQKKWNSITKILFHCIYLYSIFIVFPFRIFEDITQNLNHPEFFIKSEILNIIFLILATIFFKCNVIYDFVKYHYKLKKFNIRENDMQNNFKKTLILGLILGILGIGFILFLYLTNFFDETTEINGTIHSGYIEKSDTSFKGEYEQADGEWKYSFRLDQGKYVINKKVNTTSGKIKIELKDDNKNITTDISNEDIEFNVVEKRKYYLNIILNKHSGSFNIELNKK